MFMKYKSFRRPYNSNASSDFFLGLTTFLSILPFVS